jgi:hypothetical protein
MNGGALALSDGETESYFCVEVVAGITVGIKKYPFGGSYGQ